MTIAEKLEGFDALVFIHPDFMPARLHDKNLRYLQNLEDATELFTEARKPVFVFPYNHNRNGRIPPKIYEQWRIIPSDDYITTVAVNEQHYVDFIAAQIRKKPSEIMLAAGGQLAHACVKFIMGYWCRNLVIDFPPHYATPSGLNMPLGYGEIINELTNIGGINGIVPSGSRAL